MKHKKKFEDTTGAIRNRVNRRTNNAMAKRQKKNDKRTNNDIQNITQKTKDRATGAPLKVTGALKGLAVPAPHVTVLLLNDTNII